MHPQYTLSLTKQLLLIKNDQWKDKKLSWRIMIRKTVVYNRYKSNLTEQKTEKVVVEVCRQVYSEICEQICTFFQNFFGQDCTQVCATRFQAI